MIQFLFLGCFIQNATGIQIVPGSKDEKHITNNAFIIHKQQLQVLSPGNFKSGLCLV